jgi:hypothetical protein
MKAPYSHDDYNLPVFKGTVNYRRSGKESIWLSGVSKVML